MNAIYNNEAVNNDDFDNLFFLSAFSRICFVQFKLYFSFCLFFFLVRDILTLDFSLSEQIKTPNL